MVAMFPANVNAIVNEIPLGGNAPTPLWVRAPMQLLYIGMVWWTAVRESPRHVDRLRSQEPVTNPAQAQGMEVR